MTCIVRSSKSDQEVFLSNLVQINEFEINENLNCDEFSVPGSALNCIMTFTSGFPISLVTVNFGDDTIENFIAQNDTVEFSHVFRNFGVYTITVTSSNRMVTSSVTSSEIMIVRLMPPLAINAPAVVENGRNSTFSSFFDSILPVDSSYGDVTFSWIFRNATSSAEIFNFRSNRTESAISRRFENLGMVSLTVRVTSRLKNRDTEKTNLLK